MNKKYFKVLLNSGWSFLGFCCCFTFYHFNQWDYRYISLSRAKRKKLAKPAVG